MLGFGPKRKKPYHIIHRLKLKVWKRKSGWNLKINSDLSLILLEQVSFEHNLVVQLAGWGNMWVRHFVEVVRVGFTSWNMPPVPLVLSKQSCALRKRPFEWQTLDDWDRLSIKKGQLIKVFIFSMNVFIISCLSMVFALYTVWPFAERASIWQHYEWNVT